MKKYLGLMALVLIAGSVQADFWSNCTANGGTIITANKYGADQGGLCNDPSDTSLTNNCNGKKFCRGGNTMNWWSAFTWCESIGGHLASFDHMCPGSQAISNHTVADACPNLKMPGTGSTNVWSKTGSGQSNALFVQPSQGIIYDGGGFNKRDSQKAAVAFCEE